MLAASRAPRAVVTLTTLLWLCDSASVRGQAATGENLSGTWRAGATAIDVKVESWGKSCGGEPASSASGGGGTVQIEHVGERVSIRGSGRTVHSDACFSQNPALRRTSASAEPGHWVTRCSTKQDDPKAEEGTYTLKLLAPDRLLYQDLSRFRWRLNDSFCVATITTVQTLTRALPGSEPAPAKAVITPTVRTKPAPNGVATTSARAPQPPALPSVLGGAPSKPLCVPGPATQLQLSPRRSRVELGERKCFRARVLDASRCQVENAKVSFALEAPQGLRATLEPNGCFIASAHAADGEGSFRVVAASGALRSEARVEVVTADLSSLVAKRLGDDAGLVAVEPKPTSASTPPSASSRTATRAVDAPQAASGLDRRMLALLLGAAAMAALLAIAFARRPRTSVVPVPSAPPSTARTAPDPTRAATEKPPVKPSPKPPSMICPTCGTRFPPGSVFCGKDGKTLIADS